MTYAPIGVFDSGLGGLTVLRSIRSTLPTIDYLYLGDNARAPYGTRSFETIFQYTWEAVKWLFDQGCPLVILACNTASAKALRNIQQKMLPKYYPDRKVLGVLRPTTEIIGKMSSNQKIGILATPGTVKSESYPIEISHFYPEIQVFQQACPMWVPLVENGELSGPGTEYFIENSLDALFQQCGDIDTLLLACTHYPLLMPVIKQKLSGNIQIIEQGPLVANALKNYLERHQNLEETISKNSQLTCFTTESPESFSEKANLFWGSPLTCKQIHL